MYTGKGRGKIGMALMDPKKFPLYKGDGGEQRLFKQYKQVLKGTIKGEDAAAIRSAFDGEFTAKAKEIAKYEADMEIKRAKSRMKQGKQFMKMLTDKQKALMNKHNAHHTPKHMAAMKKSMLAGKTFTQAHKIAKKKVGN